MRRNEKYTWSNEKLLGNSVHKWLRSEVQTNNTTDLKKSVKNKWKILSRQIFITHIGKANKNNYAFTQISNGSDIKNKTKYNLLLN